MIEQIFPLLERLYAESKPVAFAHALILLEIAHWRVYRKHKAKEESQNARIQALEDTVKALDEKVKSMEAKCEQR